MTLNDKEFKHIMQPIVKFGLAKAGISSTLHTEADMGLVLLEALEFLTPS